MLKYLFLLVVLASYQGASAEANGFKQNSILPGDNVITILKKNGFNEAQRDSVLRTRPEIRQLFLTLDTKYLSKSQSGATEVRLYDSQTPMAFRIWRQNKKAGVEPVTSVKTTLLRVDGRLNGSLMENIWERVRSNWIASRFIDAYVFDLRPKQLVRGARFWFTVEKKYDQGQFVKFGEVTQTSLEVEGRSQQKQFIRSNRGGVFITEQDLLSPKPFYAPVDYIRVASLFQPHRRHPITKRLQPHMGVDFELPAGERVMAAKQGYVVRFGRSHAAGNYVVLRHAGGVETSYNHMSKLESAIRVGLPVKAGDKIGEVGCTGYCTRAHLHFAIRAHGQMVDPLRYTKAYPAPMEGPLQKRIASY